MTRPTVTNGMTDEYNVMRASFSHRSKIVIVTIILGACAMSLTFGQIQDRRAVQSLIRRLQNNSASNAIFVEPTAPIMNLFTRAEEGILRRDWKFAIDSLQRIIDDPEASLMPRDENVQGEAILYESARRKALQQIATLPPEGLRAYRLLYDGKAKGYLERAKASHNPDLLRLIVNRYLLSRYGDDAADLLASWALDEGRVTEALSVLKDVLELVPDSDVPRHYIASKLAAIYTLMGREQDAKTVIADYKERAAQQEDVPEWFDHLTDIAMTSTERAGDGREIVEWPMRGGSPQRVGRMAAVSPTLMDSTPWRYQLSGSSSYSRRQTSNREDGGPDVLPVVHAVADDHHLFIRKPSGCVALDLDELRVIWEFPPLKNLSTISLGSTTSASLKFARWSANIAYAEDVIGAIALADDQVFTVEPDGRGSIPGQDGVDVQQTNRGVMPFRSGRVREDTATRLVAYDADTGKMRWHRGRTYDPNDALGDVQFLSLPLYMHGVLWLTYLDRADLYFGVLDPDDGSLVRRILLGSYRAIPSGRGTALQPAFDEDVFYVPTNLGLLFAVDAKSFEVRWASQYRLHTVNQISKKPRRRRPVRRPAKVQSFLMNTWLASPPVVSGGYVLLTAKDTNEIQAFSTVNGDLRWAVSVEDRYYMIGADRRYVWLGGRSISCHSIADGSLVWKFDVEDLPTGRAVLSGDVVHVPTSDGLTTLDAGNGQVLRQDVLTGSQPPLGNLLCLRSTLYSIDPGGVRLYPDVDRIHATLLSEYQSHPHDFTVALRLAWMQLLRGEPRQAYDTLQEIPEEIAQQDSWRVDSIAHVRVSALQKMADQFTGQPEQALELLKKAGQIARRPSDRLEVSLTIARHRSAKGDHLGAYEILYQLGVQQDASVRVSREDHVEVGLRFDLARRMRRIVEKLKPSQHKRLIAHMFDRFEEARTGLEDATHAKPSRRLLTATADLDVVGGIGSTALLTLADWEFKHQRYERVEQLLLDCVRRDENTNNTIVSLMKLYELYSTEAVGMMHQASVILDHLDSRFARVTLPIDLLQRMGWQSAGTIKEEIVEDWIVHARDKLDMKMKEIGLPGDHTALVALGDEPLEVWTLEPQSSKNRQGVFPFTLTGDLQRSLGTTSNTNLPRMIHFDDDTLSVLGDRVLFRSRGDIIYCQRAETGSLLWQTTLQLPRTFEHVINTRISKNRDLLRRAVADGQIAVFNGREGLFAVGLLTGRRLWVIPYDIPSEWGQEALRDRLMAANSGFLAAMPSIGRLSMIRLRDGYRVWERDLRGERVSQISLSPDVIITVDHSLQRVHLFSREDGRLIQRVRFRQPDREGVLLELIETDGILCGPDAEEQSDVVKGIEISSGKEVWRIAVDKPVVQLFQPQEGFIGMGLLGGDVRVVRAKTGEVLLEHRIPNVHAVVGGEMLDATFIVRSLNKQRGRLFYELVAMDIPTGAEVWRRHDVVATLSGDRPTMLIGRTLPAVIEYQDPEDARRSRLGLVMIDTRTGVDHGGIADLISAISGTRLNGDLAVLPGAAIIGTTGQIGQIRAFQTELVGGTSGGDF